MRELINRIRLVLIGSMLLLGFLMMPPIVGLNVAPAGFGWGATLAFYLVEVAGVFAVRRSLLLRRAAAFPGHPRSAWKLWNVIVGGGAAYFLLNLGIVMSRSDSKKDALFVMLGLGGLTVVAIARFFWEAHRFIHKNPIEGD